MQKKEIYLDKPLGYDIRLENKIARLVRENKIAGASVFNLPKVYKKDPAYWFQASNLRWRLSDQKLVCTGGIVLNKGEVSGYAEKLEGDVGLEKVTLEGNPRLVIHLNGNAPATLEAQVFEVLNTKDQFLAHGGVTINYLDIRASAESASYLSASQQVLLEGSARARQGENHLSGEKIMVSLKNQKISLLGKSKVIVKEEK